MAGEKKQPLQPSNSANIPQANGNGVKGKTIEETYQKKTQLEHILLRPDTYVGSVEKHTQSLWVYEGNEMVQRSISYVPGLYKIFDEILVNAADNKQRDPSMDSVKVTISVEDNCISVYNNGDGVPVEIHQEEGVYVPEMIFGHLLTSSNYDDSEKKTTGGRNGYGAKLANIFSTEFIIETADGKRQKKYKQVFSRTRSEILARLTTCLLILVTVQPIWANPPATLPDGERKGNCSYVLEVETTCAPFAETSDNISVRFGDSAGNHVIHKKLKYSKPVFKPLSEQKLMGLTEKKPFDRCSFDKFKVEGPCMQADVCYLYFKRVGTDQWRPGYAKIQAIVSEDGDVELMSPASEYTFYFRNFLPSHVWFGYNYCDNAEKHHLASLQEKKHNFIAHKKP